MSMMDWNTTRKRVVAGLGGLAKLNPDTVRGYVALSGANRKTGHLDTKTRELVSTVVYSACALDAFEASAAIARNEGVAS